ncbi:hypothetical protein AVEN_83893-1 [Araneus ventricosus]|uniref:Uncharacterized protein n=1 Tax=Araneus ventricosus TaxID=182803 RepID=A0A4Y2VIM0_ARAVE|nr:hypothetical protein AVEN_83893-1 [Araneus ventricosus]
MEMNAIVTNVMYVEGHPTSRIMVNGTLFTNIQERRNTGNRKNTALAPFSKESKQQVNSNNSNSTNNSAQRLAADQLAMRRRLQRDSCRSTHVPRLSAYLPS